MRSTLIILFTFFCAETFSQIIVDSTVIQQYDSAYKKLPSNTRASIERTQNELLKSYDELSEESKKKMPYYPLGIAVVSFHVIDTLNLDQLNQNTYFAKPEKYSTLFCEAILKSDTLGIILYPGVAQNSNIAITHMIIGNEVQVGYNEWHDYDTTFRISLNEEKTNNLSSIAALNKFVLSGTSFTDGKIIYGYSDIITNSYYVDDVNFKPGYIFKRLLFRYYFKFIVKQSNK